MSRHQGEDRQHKGSGRQGGYRKNSNSRGNAPVKSYKKPTEKSVTSDEIRLNRYLSNAGVCSRRDADIYIKSGNVSVNGNVITEMGFKVKPSDKVIFDGKLLKPEKNVYILLNKPKNFSTSDDNSKINSVNSLIQNATKTKVLPIGRMDATTTGLLLFTNDAEMVNKFTNGKQRSSKIYQISLDKNLKPEDFEKIKNGISIENYKVFPEEISYVQDQPKSEIGLKIKTSNIKVVRKIFESLHYNVLKLDRVSFAGLTKKNLPRGNWRFLTEQEVINLKNI